MSLVEHLRELRRRVVIALAAIAVGTILGYTWYGNGFLGIPSLGEILRGPYCNLPPEMRFGSSTGECRLLSTAPFEQFTLRLKMGFIAGLVLSAPFWLGQLWGFVTPGLKKNEKMWTRVFVGVATLLFVGGAALAFYVINYGLEFLLGIGSEAQIAALTGTSYFNFLLMLLLIFGLSFELPLVIVMLNLVGVLRYNSMKDKRRYIILFLFIFAAFATPGGDPVTMLILATSMCLMMEIAMQIAHFNDYRLKKKGLIEDFPDDLDDESASSIGTTDAVNGSSTVAAPAPVQSAPTRSYAPNNGTPSNSTSTESANGSNNFDDIL
ncbi:MAG TPA: twin-arginine translocase subunit TatC [Candidatus Corynebacterium avicola]|uniref:Sec-independent protein translocase protein TatC n=1 Tax=Candidatus Corynebacterium avicola TaxID=2838527 RepID=A0A9D1RNB5_9CORY|nr:twin-arginine translocase subunit TatC [Candidatus Corynebacterium avicola]